MVQHPLVQRLFDVKFDTKRFVALATHGGKDFPDAEGRKFFADHFDLTIQASILYMVVIFGTKWFMRNRQPFQLTVPLNIWNFILAVFSIAGAIKTTPEFFGTLANKGFVASYCKVFGYTQGENGYWVWLFMASKLFELVDTMFLVLRKRPLMFLHWYHHILTMIYAWHSHYLAPGFNRYGIYLNLVVHAFMYTYYFLRSMRIRVPGVISKAITSLQILQFIISVAILTHLGYIIHFQNAQCDFDPSVFKFAVFMDTTYLILFINFFLQSYVFRGGKDKYKAVPQKKKAQ